MNILYKIIKTVFFLFILTLNGCVSNPHLFSIKAAELSIETSSNKLLKSLDPPEKQIVVAVYNFSDQTGQFKSTSTGPTNSKAVSQGTTSMLIKALMDSNWFIVIEREGLNNLINERKIFDLANNDKIMNTPTLLYADLLIEGGVISYESNILSGGSGAKYLGIGANIQYRQDEVTVFLRAVSARTGQIIKSVNTTKSIFSIMQNIGVYKYVDALEILEIETGFSVNEPPQTCVLEAIEKGVHSLIIEGILDGLWESSNENIHDSDTIKNFREEQQLATIANMDKSTQQKNRTMAIGLNGGFQSYIGDYSDKNIDWYLDANFKYFLFPQLSTFIKAGTGVLSSDNHFETTLLCFDLGLEYSLFPGSMFSPFLSTGISLFNFRITNPTGKKIMREDNFYGWKPAISSYLGLRYNLSKEFSLNTHLKYYYSFTDQVDGVISGNKPDSIWSIGLGCNYYF